jgi:hypothetical protein
MINFFDTKPEGEKTFEKTRFLAFTPGKHIVRILGQPLTQYIHFVPFSKATLACLGDDCPICKNNRKLMIESPEDYSKQSGFLYKQRRHLMNILDRTPVKVCPQCQNENKRGITGKFSANCWSCNTFITEVPVINSNKVKVATISETNAARLNNKMMSNLDENENPIPLNEIDVIFESAIVNNKKDIAPSLSENRDKVEVPEDALYDLSKITIKLTSDEIINHLKGVSLKDIFAARKSTANEKITEDAIKVRVDVQKKIDELFGQ